MSEQDKKPNIRYFVWNVEEVLSVCTKAELMKFDAVTDRIIRKREESGQDAVKRFIVVSEDDPYYREVQTVIKNFTNS
jgi:hypothetical protein